MAFNMFPYSNLHSLNMDWILTTLREALSAAEQARTTVQGYNDRLTATENGVTSLNNSVIKHTQQNLNALEKAIARVNIDAQQTGGYLRYDNDQSLTDEQAAQVAANGGFLSYKQEQSLSQEDMLRLRTNMGILDESEDLLEVRNALTSSSVPATFTPNLTWGYISGTNGIVTGTSHKYCHSALYYGKPRILAVNLNSATYKYYISYYNSNGNISTGAGYLGYTATKSGVIFLPANANMFAITISRADGETMDNDEVQTIRNTLLSRWYYTDNTLTEQGKVADAQVTGDRINAIQASAPQVTSTDNIIDCYMSTSGILTSSTVRTVKTLYLPCKPNLTYKIKHSLTSTLRIGCFTTVPSVGGTATKHYDGSDEQITFFTTDSTATYLALYFYTNYYDTLPVETIYNDLEISTFALDSLTDLVIDTIHNQPVLTRNFYISNDGVSVVSTAAEVWALYDDLVTKYPNYVSKNTLSGSGGFTNYEYVFTSGNYNAQNGQRSQNALIKKPVLLITTGVHGNEKSAVLSMYSVLKSMCEYDYSLNPIMDYVTIKIVPVVTPWAYDNSSRINANGVNINRNFNTTGWTSTGAGTNNYSGASAADQVETQVMQDWIDNNTDAIMLLDCHNSAYLSEISCILGSQETNSVKIKKLYLAAINNIIPYWQNSRGLLGSSYILSYTGGNSLTPGVQVTYAVEQGLDASQTFETSQNIKGTGVHSKFTIGVGAEAIAAFLAGLHKYYIDF